jgi:hypothetical protein
MKVGITNQTAKKLVTKRFYFNETKCQFHVLNTEKELRKFNVNKQEIEHLFQELTDCCDNFSSLKIIYSKERLIWKITVSCWFIGLTFAIIGFTVGVTQDDHGLFPMGYLGVAIILIAFLVLVASYVYFSYFEYRQLVESYKLKLTMCLQKHEHNFNQRGLKWDLHRNMSWIELSMDDSEKEEIEQWLNICSSPISDAVKVDVNGPLDAETSDQQKFFLTAKSNSKCKNDELPKSQTSRENTNKNDQVYTEIENEIQAQRRSSTEKST